MRQHDDQIRLTTLGDLKIPPDALEHFRILRALVVDQIRRNKIEIAADKLVGLIIIDAVSISENRHLDPVALDDFDALRLLLLERFIGAEVIQLLLTQHINRAKGAVELHVENMIVGVGDQSKARALDGIRKRVGKIYIEKNPVGVIALRVRHASAAAWSLEHSD